MVIGLLDKIYSNPEALCVTADIDMDNELSRRTLLSCGFVQLEENIGRYVHYKN